MAVVYIISKDKIPLYVGSTGVTNERGNDKTALSRRLYQHINKPNGIIKAIGEDIDKLKCHAITGLCPADARAIEIILINQFQPDYNSNDLYFGGSKLFEILFPMEGHLAEEFPFPKQYKK